MSDARARRRIPIDPRLLVGIALVVLSVAGVVALVGAADQRVVVLAAADTLVPGERIREGDLLLRSVALEGGTALYLRPGDIPAAGAVSTRVVRAGELVPRAALGEGAGDTTAIVLPLTGPVSASVTAGAAVDVWSTARATPGDEGGESGSGPPVVLSADAIVVAVLEPDGIVGAADGDSVEVLIPRAHVARVLQALAQGDALAVVPAGIPLAPR